MRRPAVDVFLESVGGSQPVDGGRETLDRAAGFLVDQEVLVVDGVFGRQEHVVAHRFCGLIERALFRMMDDPVLDVKRIFDSVRQIKFPVEISHMTIAPSEDPQQAVNRGRSIHLLLSDTDVRTYFERHFHKNAGVVFVNSCCAASG